MVMIIMVFVYPSRTILSIIKTRFDEISIPTELGDWDCLTANCPLRRFARKTTISSALTVGNYNERPRVRARALAVIFPIIDIS